MHYTPEVQAQVRISLVLAILLFIELDYIILIEAQCEFQTQKECNYAASCSLSSNYIRTGFLLDLLCSN